MDAGRKLRRLSVQPSPGLAEGQIAEVLEAARSAEQSDGAPPLNDEQLMALRHPAGLPDDATVTHFPMLQAVGGPDEPGGPDGPPYENRLVGYGQLIEQGRSPEQRDRPTGTLFVHPDHRRQGLGRALIARMHESTAGNVHLWAPGDPVSAQRLARAARMVPVRELLVMSRSLDDPLPETRVPAGIRIRNFVISRDQPGFLQVNARAFAHHPEQGRLAAPALRARIKEPWFDRTGFLVAVDGSAEPDPSGSAPGTTKDGRIVGFHWTKRHGPTGPDGTELGEVYVLGVDPDAGGHGLGKALLARGLERLRDQGCRTVILYVEGDHDAAIGLYEHFGFRTTKRDVLYAQHLDLPSGADAENGSEPTG